MWFLFIILMSATPSFAQVTELSPTAQSLLNNAHRNKVIVKNTNRPLGFNAAFITRFDGMVVLPNAYTPFSRDTYNINSLELYYPDVWSSAVRIMTTFRFGWPISYNMKDTCLGFGVGVSTILSDLRNVSLTGLVTSFNTIFAIDFPINDLEMIKYRFDFGIRWNYFFDSRFAVVMGLDLGVGLSAKEYEAYDIFGNLRGYEHSLIAMFSIGASAGIMF